MANSYFQGYCDSLIQSSDFISFSRRVYEIVGRNAPSAMILERICYWHGTSAKTGKCRLQKQSGGYLWLAKHYEDWEEECCVNASTARKAIARLETLGIIETKMGMFNDVKTLLIRVIPERFEELSKSVGQSDQNGHMVSDQNGHILYIQESTVKQESTTKEKTLSDAHASGEETQLSTAKPTNEKTPAHLTAKRSSQEHKFISTIITEQIYNNGTLDLNHGNICDWLYIWYEPIITEKLIEQFVKWYFGKGNTVMVRQIKRVKGIEFQGKFCYWFDMFLDELKPKTAAAALPTELPAYMQNGVYDE